MTKARLTACVLVALCWLVAGAVSIEAYPCEAGTGFNYSSNVVRWRGNDVWSFGSAYVEGTYWWYHRPKVTSTSKLNGNVLSGRQGVVDVADYGYEALNEWHDAPQATGTGVYSIENHIQWLPRDGCDTAPYDYNLTEYLTVSRPTIQNYGILGVWWLGGGSDPDNDFFNQVLLDAEKNCGAGDSCTETPVWSKVETGEGQISLDCTYCVSNVATSQHPSAPGQNFDITIKFSIGGFESTPLSFYVNAPHDAQLRSVDGIVNEPFEDGYMTAYAYHTWDRWGNALPSMAFNEQFGVVQYDRDNDWPSFEAAGQPGFDFNTWYDVIFAHDGQDWNPQPTHPQDPLSDVGITYAPQTWRFGSATVGSGVAVQTDVLRFYIDHGMHDPPVVSPVNQ